MTIMKRISLQVSWLQIILFGISRHWQYNCKRGPRDNSVLFHQGLPSRTPFTKLILLFVL
jgi:hypothetical protein